MTQRNGDHDQGTMSELKAGTHVELNGATITNIKVAGEDYVVTIRAKKTKIVATREEIDTITDARFVAETVIIEGRIVEAAVATEGGVPEGQLKLGEGEESAGDEG